jgi:hypothetical protein
MFTETLQKVPITFRFLSQKFPVTFAVIIQKYFIRSRFTFSSNNTGLTINSGEKIKEKTKFLKEVDHFGRVGVLFHTELVL